MAPVTFQTDQLALVFKVVLLLTTVLVLFLSIDEQSDEAVPAVSPDDVPARTYRLVVDLPLAQPYDREAEL